jgi:hypothetical protein
MIEALDSGTTFCFVHYNEEALSYDSNAKYFDSIPNESFQQFYSHQIGFRWITASHIVPLRQTHTVHTGTVLRSEFRTFLIKWGASHNIFVPHYKFKFDEVIYAASETEALGFRLQARKGHLIYLPFQRNYSKREDLLNSIQTLIDSLLTYLSKLITSTPDWGEEAFFQEESVIQTECGELESKLEAARARLNPFREAKALLFQSEYTLETTVPKFFGSHLGIDTEREDKHLEDFWILNEQKERIAIAEVKSKVKGFSKSGIYDIYRHREENNLDEPFPAILIVNANLQAGSFQDKDTPINKQDYQLAAQDNVLIVRVEDLVRLWDALRQGRIQSKEVLTLFLTKRGWLHVDKDLNIREKQ